MEIYQPQNAVFSRSIPITETTDTNHANNINAAPKQLIENDIALDEKIDSYGYSIVDGKLCVTYESED